MMKPGQGIRIRSRECIMFQVVVQSGLRRMKSIPRHLPPPPERTDKTPHQPEQAGGIPILILILSILLVVLFTR